MTTRWIVDSCDCIIEFNKNVNWVKSVNNCRLHKNLKGQRHLDTVIAQNKRFNLSMGDIPNEQEIRIMSLSKEINKRKIRIKDFTEDIPDKPEEMVLSFWENIRSRLPF